MAIEQAWLLKGFVLAHNAPPAVLEAAEALIAAMEAASICITGSPVPPLPDVFPHSHEGQVQSVASVSVCDQPTESPSQMAEKKVRKPWSPEAREAAAERMRARQAAGLMKKGKPENTTADAAPKQFSPVSVEKLQRDHNGYAGKRDPDQELLDSDWPDIKNMLDVKRMSVSQVASDYDVSFGTLRSFIDKHEALEEQPLGEARAPSKAGA